MIFGKISKWIIILKLLGKKDNFKMILKLSVL